MSRLAHTSVLWGDERKVLSVESEVDNRFVTLTAAGAGIDVDVQDIPWLIDALKDALRRSIIAKPYQ